MKRVAGILLMVAGLVAAQTTPASRIRTPSVLPISSIAITGNKTLSTDAIIAASGLKIHDEGGSAAFDAARDRLLDTGYFDVISYSFRQQDLGFAVTFNVKEFPQVFPIHIEALPISVEQAKAAIKAKDPLFNGLLPVVKKVVDRAAGWIQESLAASNPGLQVSGRVVQTSPDHFEVLFTPAEGLPVIADMTFEGSRIVKDSDMHDAMIENGIGQPFSDDSVRSLLDKFIRPLFEKQGYMGVRFAKITSKPAEKVKGIDVHVVVEDGPRFRLGSVSVRGPAAGDAAHILRIASLPRDEFADGDEIEKAVTRIRDNLVSEGYLDATVSTGHTIDTARTVVNPWFEVSEGELYKFGRLEVLGLGLDGEAAIRKMWNVKPGDPYPGGYPDYFVKAVKGEGLFDNLGDITATPSINRQTRLVDVTLHFSGAPPVSQQRRNQY
jgi:outer membrane protein insertion porin family